jgi:hypothetical protein
VACPECRLPRRPIRGRTLQCGGKMWQTIQSRVRDGMVC